MAAISDLVEAIDSLREVVAREVRSRQRILLILVAMILLLSGLSYVRGSGSIEQRNLQVAQASCNTRVTDDALASALRLIDLNARASMNRLPATVPVPLPPPPSLAEFEQGRRDLVAAEDRLRRVVDICYREAGPDPTPLSDPIDR